MFATYKIDAVSSTSQLVVVVCKHSQSFKPGSVEGDNSESNPQQMNRIINAMVKIVSPAVWTPVAQFNLKPINNNLYYQDKTRIVVSKYKCTLFLHPYLTVLEDAFNNNNLILKSMKTLHKMVDFQFIRFFNSN